MNKEKSITNARTLLRQSELGVLSTHSKANDGFPFGSVSTYISTVNGDVIFYISDLAQHTKNIKQNDKMCLTVFANSDNSTEDQKISDPNDGARLSILGHVKRIDNEETIQQRFFALYPDSRRYQGTHDFAFYKLSCERVRFIGGFGDIHWISKDEWSLETPKWLATEQSMINHMNEDHRDAMQLMCEHHFGIQTGQAQMLAVNPDGCFLRADNSKPLYISFEANAHTSEQARQELVKLTHAARTALNPPLTNNPKLNSITPNHS